MSDGKLQLYNAFNLSLILKRAMFNVYCTHPLTQRRDARGCPAIGHQLGFQCLTKRLLDT